MTAFAVCHIHLSIFDHTTNVPEFVKLSPVSSQILGICLSCGSGTSVQFLYRVDELLDGAPTAHLVFFDRHGWYCVHGRACTAVDDVRKHARIRA